MSDDTLNNHFLGKQQIPIWPLNFPEQIWNTQEIGYIHDLRMIAGLDIGECPLETLLIGCVKKRVPSKFTQAV